MFSFEQLRGFVAVAEELHFGRAATRLSPKPVELHLLWARDSQNPALPVALEALRNQ